MNGNHNMHQSPEHDTAKQMTDQMTGLGKDVGKQTGKAIGKGAKKAGRKMAKKAVKAGAKVAAKVAIAVGKAIISALLFLLPYILILLAIVIVCLGIWYAVHEVRGHDQNYSFETRVETSQTVEEEEEEKKGFYSFFGQPKKTTKLTDHDMQVRSFYEYFGTKRSYYQIVGDDNTKLITPEHEDAVQDYYNKERQYTINPNFLFVLDEFVYKRDFRFPEQFIEPVNYDPDKLELVHLTDETGDLTAESTKYDKDGMKTDEKELGIWDYGFASIFKYKEDKVTRTVEGTYTSKDVWDDATKSVKQVPINEPFVEVMDGYPQPIHIMTHAITFVGDYKFEYENKKEQVGELSQQGGKNSKPNEPVNRIYYSTYDHYETVCSTSTDPETGEETESCHQEYRGSYDLYKYREGAVYETKPVEKEQPDPYEGLSEEEKAEKEKEEEGRRMRYFKDYLYYFKSYVPESVMIKFDYKERVGDGFYGGVQTSVNFAIGSYANLDNSSFARAMQYYGIAQKWGSVYQVEPEAIIAMIAQESGGRADINDGLMQIVGDGKRCTQTPSTGPAVCVYSEADRRNPDKAIEWGVAYLRTKLDKYGGDYLKAIQSHNLDPQYIFNKYPETANSTEWLKYREEMRLYYGQKEGYGITRSANYDCMPELAKSSGMIYGDVCYLEHVLRYYAGSMIVGDGTGGIINGGGDGTEAGDSLGGGLMNAIGNAVTGLLNFFGIEPKNYLEDEPRNGYAHKIPSYEAEWFIKSMTTFDEELRFSQVDESSFIPFWSKEFNKMHEGQLSKEEFLALFGEVDTVPPLAIKNPRVSAHFGSVSSVHSKGHGGIDLAVPKGTPIYAVADAKVVKVVKTGMAQTGWGYYIKLQFNSNPNVYVLYAHLSEVYVDEGQEVSMGENIGRTGGVPGEPGAGRTTGPHLHFELYNGSTRVDPRHIALQPDKFL